MERFWLKHYPPGVPADVDLTQYRSLVHLLDDGLARFAARDAYVFMDRRVTFAEVDRQSAGFGAWLQARGLAPGARVALMMPNVPQYPIALAGVLRAGCVVVNVNPLYTPRELEHQLRDSGAEAIVVLENFATTLQQVIAKTAVRQVVVASIGDLLGFAEGARRTLAKPDVGPDDIAFLQYTGGTTGVSKGATLLHRNMVANVLQLEAWVKPALGDSSRGPVPEQFVYVCALPLYHVFALVVNCLAGVRL